MRKNAVRAILTAVALMIAVPVAATDPTPQEVFDAAKSLKTAAIKRTYDTCFAEISWKNHTTKGTAIDPARHCRGLLSAIHRYELKVIERLKGHFLDPQTDKDRLSNEMTACYVGSNYNELTRCQGRLADRFDAAHRKAVQ